MAAAIEKLALPVYDFRKVDLYLAHQAQKQGSQYRWVWRAADMQSWKVAKDSSAPPEVGLISPRIYSRAIPMGVMELVAKIRAEIPAAVLLASDYEVINPDPFLAVSSARLLEAGRIWVVAQWDEPGFDNFKPENWQ